MTKDLQVYVNSLDALFRFAAWRATSGTVARVQAAPKATRRRPKAVAIVCATEPLVPAEMPEVVS